MDDTFAGRLRAIRLEQHKSQEATAHRAGLSVAHYNRLEAGKHSPILSTVERLAAALGVHPATLAAKSDKTGQDSHSYPEDHDNFPRAS
jgi:transcriptional regulator with XRE-family HTH domain